MSTTGTERVLITGGAGLIGSHIADLLVDEGRFVTVFDNFSVGHERNLAHLAERRNVRIVRGDILESVTLQQLVAQHDLVFHMAAGLGVANAVRHPVRLIVTNVRGTENVLSACYDLGRPVVVASTSEVYGKSAKVPFREEDDRVLGPTSVTRWSYSTAKALDEHLALGYHQLGLPVTVVRYFNTYGPRMHGSADGSQVIAKFIRMALTDAPITVHGDGQQTRCFTFVEDTARATVLAGNEPAARGQVLNIGSDRETSIQHLAEMIRDRAGSRSEIRHVPYAEIYGANFEDTPRRVPDISKAKRMLGFEPSVQLEEGLDRTLIWSRERMGA